MYRRDPTGKWFTVPVAESIEKSFEELAQFQLSRDGLLQQ